MKTLASLTLASIVLLSACAASREAAVNVAASESAPATSSARDYRCESGETIVATYPSSDSATIRYKDDTRGMNIAVSGSGTRYIGGDLEWWTKGSGRDTEGTLFRHAPDGTTGDAVERCSAS